MITVNTNARDVRDWLRSIEKRQVPFATALALTTLAREAKTDIPGVLERRLDNPTPFTKRGVGMRPATKQRLESRVFMKDKQAEYLSLQATGGTRRPKRKALVVPSQARRNKYGNIPRGGVKRLLARADTFSGEVNGTPGIYKRLRGGGLQLLIAYASEAQYTKRVDFHREVKTIVDRKLYRVFRDTYRRVMG